jgi:HK97 family phage prohead protease
MEPEINADMLKKQYVAETKEVDDEERTVTALISTGTVDRDKEVMLPKGADLEKYLKNPVVLWAHDYHSPPIARTLWMKQGRKGIQAKAQFAPAEDNPMSEQVYQLYKKGYMNAFSVGFIIKDSHEPTPDEIKKRPELAEARKIISDWELLEFSAVPVPANPEALAQAIKIKEIELSSDLIEQLDIDDIEVFIPDKGESIELDAALKPYPNEHACRLLPPNFDKYNRVNCDQKHDGKCIDVIYGIKGGKSKIQALRYPKKIWTAAAARSHCAGRGGSFEAAKIEMQSRPTLTRHPIVKRGYDPEEIRAITIAKIKGKVSLK